MKALQPFRLFVLSIWNKVFTFSDDLGFEAPRPGVVKSFFITFKHFLFRPVSSSQAVLKGRRLSGVMKPVPFVLACLLVTTVTWWIQVSVVGNRDTQWFPELLTLRNYDKDRFYTVFPELRNVSFKEALIQEVFFEAANDSRSENVISGSLPDDLTTINPDYIIRRIAAVDQSMAKDYQTLRKVKSIYEEFERFWESNGHVVSILLFGTLLQLLFKKYSTSLVATVSMYAYLSQTWTTVIDAPLMLLQDVLLESTINGGAVSATAAMMFSPLTVIAQFAAVCFPYYVLYRIYPVQKRVFVIAMLFAITITFILSTTIWFILGNGWMLLSLRDDFDAFLDYRRIFTGAFKSILIN